MWERIREDGFDVKVFDRNIRNREKGVDMEMGVDIAERLHNVTPPNTIVIAAGDADYVPAVARAQREIADFYRVEFQKHRARLSERRRLYGESTYKQVDDALGRLLAEIDLVVGLENFEDLAGQLLAKIDSITHLSSRRTPSRRIH